MLRYSFVCVRMCVCVWGGGGGLRIMDEKKGIGFAPTNLATPFEMIGEFQWTGKRITNKR